MTTKQYTMPLKNTYDGKAIAVLHQIDEIEKGNTSVLYVHGFNDYFFHHHLSENLIVNGYNFFALDLRRYANARLSHQKPFFVKSISEYYEEISLAIEKIIELTNSDIVLMGHSTGGLTAPLFTQNFQDKYPIKSLILNSPFFDISLKEPFLSVLKFYKFLAKFSPYTKIPQMGDSTLNYTKSLHKKFFGEWDYDFQHKFESKAPLYSGWIKAVMDAQQLLKAGLDIKCPVLILHSDKSYFKLKYDSKFHESDVILGVNQMKKYGKVLGQNVSILQIDNAVHDVYLSKPEVRENAMAKTIFWLKNNVK